MNILKSCCWYLLLHFARNAVARLSPDQCVNVADAVLQISAGDQSAMELRLLGLYGTDRYEEAIQFSSEILTLYPDDAFAYSVRAEVFTYSGENESALNACSELLARCPGSTTALMMKAGLLGEMGLLDLAVGCYDDIICREDGCSSDVFMACLAKGGLLMKMSKTADLKRFCDQLALRFPDEPSVLSMIGTFRRQMGETHEGIECYRQALRHTQPNSDLRDKLVVIIDDAEEDDRTGAKTPV